MALDLKRFHFFLEDETGNLLILTPGYEDRLSANKDMRALDVGRYHLLKVIEKDITVEPPPVTNKNKVVRGTTLDTRAKSPNKGKKAKKAKLPSEELTI